MPQPRTFAEILKHPVNPMFKKAIDEGEPIPQKTVVERLIVMPKSRFQRIATADAVLWRRWKDARMIYDAHDLLHLYHTAVVLARQDRRMR